MPRVRSVSLSDIHLGARACRAGRLLEFLKEYPAGRTYLAGDINIAGAANHVTAGGRELLVIHGDGFDRVTRHDRCAATKQLGGLSCVNCGDRVDSCCAIVEHADGRQERGDRGVFSLLAVAALQAAGEAEN